MDWVEIQGRPGRAAYHRIVDINLSELAPLTARPHSPDNISTVRDVGEIEVNQVCIGSCTNSSYRDLAYGGRRYCGGQGGTPGSQPRPLHPVPDKCWKISSGTVILPT